MINLSDIYDLDVIHVTNLTEKIKIKYVEDTYCFLHIG